MSFNPSCDSVQATNDDATAVKAHAVRRGYWQDPFIKYFCPIPNATTPEISRGYFLRVKAFEAMITRFVKDSNNQCQLVNIGAGSDTLYFRLNIKGLFPQAYVELDLPANVQKKILCLRRSKALWEALSEGTTPPPTEITDHLSVGHYHIFSSNLVESPSSLISLLCDVPGGPMLSPDLPTLFIAECVLVYIPTVSSNALLSELANKFKQAAFLHYEQVNMDDRFGEIMRNNFRDRVGDLPGLSSCGSLEAQKIRFREAGWSEVHAWTVNEIYNALPKETMLRIERLEMLDDTEITKQLYDHYCILLAVNSDSICQWTSLVAALAVIT